MFRQVFLFTLALGLSPWLARATEQVPIDDEAAIAAAKFESSLNYSTGRIVLADGLAELSLPPEFRYLDSNDSKRVLEDAWGNPNGDGTLGMVLPSEVSPLSPEGWAVIITYDEDGYVPDDEADSIDYDELLSDMRESTADANEERTQAGYEAVTLVGWAETPSYDKAAHKMVWAKELAFGDDPSHTLNYNIRILGRRGVLVLNAVSGMDQLPMIKATMPGLVEATDFNPGHTYAEFDPKIDKKAAYGLAALVAGGLAAKKLGLVALIGAFAAKFAKVIIAAVVAGGAIVAKFFGRKTADKGPIS